MASIRSDLEAVSYVDLTEDRRAEAWIQENVPAASSVRPYDLTVCTRARQDEAFAGAAPTALVLVEQPRTEAGASAPLPRVEDAEIERVSVVRANHTEWVLYARRPRRHRDPVRLSLVVPCRDQARSLWRLLTALAADDEAPTWELIIVNRGSFDETRELLAAVTGELQQLDLPRESTLADAMKAGLDRATGELVAVLDPELIPSPGWMRRVCEALDVYTDAVSCSGRVMDGDEEVPQDSSVGGLEFRFFAVRRRRFLVESTHDFTRLLTAAASTQGAHVVAPNMPARRPPLKPQ